MNAAEYLDAILSDDPRVGRCPYCQAPGWITGDPAWCEHYAGTFDTMDVEQPSYPFLAGEPFAAFAAAIAELAAQPAAEQATLLATLAPDMRQLLAVALDSFIPLDAWREFAAPQTLTVAVTDPVYPTAFVSLFVADREAVRQQLAAAFGVALATLQEHNTAA